MLAGTVGDVSGAVDLVKEYLAALAGGDPDRIAAFVAEDFVNEHLSALGTGCHGRAEYARRLPQFLASFTGRTYAVEEVVHAGGRPRGGPSSRADLADVVVRYRFTAEFDGQPIDIPGVMWFGVRGREIARRVDVWDSLTFLQQTGQR